MLGSHIGRIGWNGRVCRIGRKADRKGGCIARTGGRNGRIRRSEPIQSKWIDRIGRKYFCMEPSLFD